MAARSAQEQRLMDRAAQCLPGSSAGGLWLPKDLNFLVQRGQGSHIWDVSGNEYIDWLMGSGPMILGHAHPRVVEAVTEAVSKGSTFLTTNDKAVLLAEEIVKAVPCAEKVRFVTSGTDADFMAMRAARAYRNRDKVLKFEGGFHGVSDYAMMSVTPSAGEEFPQAVPDSAGIPKAIQDLMLIAPFNDLDTTSAIIEAHHDEMAAVIVEPLQRAIPPQPGFLQGLRDVTARYDIPLIFDEVVTGFRLAYGGAQEYYGVTPDLCTMGKALGGGHPLAAVMGRSDIMSVFGGGYNRSAADDDVWVNQTGNLNGAPIACAAGLATLAEMRKEGAYESVRATGRRLRQALADICDKNGIPVQIGGEEAVFDIFFSDRPVVTYRDGLAADSQMMTRFVEGLLERRILRGQLKFYPSVVHSEDDVDRTIEVFEEVIPTLRG